MLIYEGMVNDAYFIGSGGLRLVLVEIVIRLRRESLVQVQYALPSVTRGIVAVCCVIIQAHPAQTTRPQPALAPATWPWAPIARHTTQRANGGVTRESIYGRV